MNLSSSNILVISLGMTYFDVTVLLRDSQYKLTLITQSFILLIVHVLVSFARVAHSVFLSTTNNNLGSNLRSSTAPSFISTIPSGHNQFD